MYKEYDELPEDIRKFISCHCLTNGERAKYAPRVVYVKCDDVVFYELNYLQYVGYCCKGVCFKSWVYDSDGNQLDWDDEHHRDTIYRAIKKLEEMNAGERIKSSVIVPHIKPRFF